MWRTEEQGVTLTICTMKAAGLTVDDFREFNNPAQWPANLHAVDDIQTCRILEDVQIGPQPEGTTAFVAYLHITTPMMVSNRASIGVVYLIDGPDGSHIQVTTTRGCESIVEANQALIGEDVVSNTPVSYMKLTNCADGSGVMVEQIVCVDPAGDLPDWVKKQIAKSNSDMLEKAVDLMRSRKGL